MASCFSILFQDVGPLAVARQHDPAGSWTQWFFFGVARHSAMFECLLWNASDLPFVLHMFLLHCFAMCGGLAERVLCFAMPVGAFWGVGSCNIQWASAMRCYEGSQKIFQNAIPWCRTGALNPLRMVWKSVPRMFFVPLTSSSTPGGHRVGVRDHSGPTFNGWIFDG